MTVRPPSGIPLPELVRVSNRVLAEEAEELREAMDYFGGSAQPGSPWTLDDQSASDESDTFAQGKGVLLYYTRRQSTLIYANAYDHLISLKRILGDDGTMPVFSQASVARVVCEAAVRYAWLMDPKVSSAKRLVRGAAL
jgi:hypothetical protein